MTATTCEALRERLPDCAAGRASLSPDEQRHLDQCPDCALEWRVVEQALRLGDAPAARIVPEALAADVLARLRREPAVVPFRRRAGWAAGVVAAAAMIFLLLGPLSGRGSVVVDPPAAPVVWLVPELDSLDTRELLLVLDTFEGPAEGYLEMGLPVVDDLGARELEQVLQAWEG